MLNLAEYRKHPASLADFLPWAALVAEGECIAACWAEKRMIPQIVFKPDWARHAKAAPFKRNDQMLKAMPIGLIVFPGYGISANPADKARKLGIPVWSSNGVAS